MARETDQIAQDYSAMLGSVSVITNCLDDDNAFCEDMSTITAAISAAEAYSA